MGNEELQTSACDLSPRRFLLSWVLAFRLNELLPKERFGCRP